MTRREALAFCRNVSDDAISSPISGYRTPNYGYAKHLRRIYPGFAWRVIIDRSCDYSRVSLTIDPKDKREHYVPVGGTCIHCGKTAKQLGVKERTEDY